MPDFVTFSSIIGLIHTLRMKIFVELCRASSNQTCHRLGRKKKAEGTLLNDIRFPRELSSASSSSSSPPFHDNFEVPRCGCVLCTFVHSSHSAVTHKPNRYLWLNMGVVFLGQEPGRRSGAGRGITT